MNASEPPDGGGHGSEGSDSEHSGMVLPPPPVPRKRIVRRSLRLVREHAVTGGLASLLILMPVSMLSAFLQRDSLDLAAFGASPASPRGSAWDVLQALVFTPWAFAAVFLLMAGRAGGLERAIAGGLRRLVHTVAAGTLAGLVCMLPFLPALVVFLAGGGPEYLSRLAQDIAVDGELVWLGDPPGFLPGVFGLILLGGPVSIYLALRLGLTVPLTVADGMSPLRALRASWSRMVGQRRRLLGAMLVLILSALVLILVVSIPMGLFMLALGPEGGWVPGAVTSSVFGAVFTLLTAAVYAVIRADTAAPEPGADPDGPEIA